MFSLKARFFFLKIISDLLLSFSPGWKFSDLTSSFLSLDSRYKGRTVSCVHLMRLLVSCLYLVWVDTMSYRQSPCRPAVSPQAASSPAGRGLPGSCLMSPTAMWHLTLYRHSSSTHSVLLCPGWACQAWLESGEGGGSNTAATCLTREQSWHGILNISYFLAHKEDHLETFPNSPNIQTFLEIKLKVIWYNWWKYLSHCEVHMIKHNIFSKFL